MVTAAIIQKIFISVLPLSNPAVFHQLTRQTWLSQRIRKNYRSEPFQAVIKGSIKKAGLNLKRIAGVFYHIHSSLEFLLTLQLQIGR